MNRFSIQRALYVCLPSAGTAHCHRVPVTQKIKLKLLHVHTRTSPKKFTEKEIKSDRLWVVPVLRNRTLGFHFIRTTRAMQMRQFHFNSSDDELYICMSFAFRCPFPVVCSFCESFSFVFLYTWLLSQSQFCKFCPSAPIFCCFCFCDMRSMPYYYRADNFQGLMNNDDGQQNYTQNKLSGKPQHINPVAGVLSTQRSVCVRRRKVLNHDIINPLLVGQ